MSFDEHVGEPIHSIPGYQTTSTVKYQLDGEAVKVVAHFFDDDSIQLHFYRGDTHQGVRLSNKALVAIDLMRAQYRAEETL